MPETKEAAEDRGLLAIDATAEDSKGLIDLGDGLKIRLDCTTYDKTARMQPGVGYEIRQNADAILAVVLHTTNGEAGSAFEAEAEYLANSRNVSSNWLISKPARGDHGEVIDPLQLRAAAWLAARCRRHHPNMYILTTHRAVAIPEGRKHDPNPFTDEEFKGWVDSFWKPAW